LAVNTGADTSAFDDVGLDEVGGPDIFAEDRLLFGKVGRLLFTVLTPCLLRRAVGAGYTRQEHDELWALFSTAAGLVGRQFSRCG
jgi:hypothetical protein